MAEEVLITGSDENKLKASHTAPGSFNSLRPRQNGRHFADDIFKCIFLNENIWIPIKISLKFVPKGSINNILALVQIMAWRRPGDKALSEPMMIISLMHIYSTWPQWVKSNFCAITYDATYCFNLTSCVHWWIMPYVVCISLKCWPWPNVNMKSCNQRYHAPIR